ncbi:MAG: hypothetical protein IKM38_01825 [Christensenellaceae bacterium]|nr:hypothetical protein [Christensenellaceae bacterium]
MSRLSMVLPNLTPDEGGAASALLPLGGLIVIHDAAGCLENYILFDEPRWFGSDAMLYTSRLSQMEAILGGDEQLVSGITEAAEKMQPKFIAIIGSPVPALIGMDLDSTAMIVEAETGIPSFAVNTSGFYSYEKGVEEALIKYTERMGKPGNIIGYTPLDLETMPENPTNKNLVVSAAGIEAAKLTGEDFVIGIPLGEKQKEKLCGREVLPAEKTDIRCLVIGEAVYAMSLAEALSLEYGWDCSAASLTEAPEELGVRYLPDEDAVERILAEQYDILIADPLFELFDIHDGCFVKIPHHALSSDLFIPIYNKDENLCGNIKAFYDIWRNNNEEND